MHPTHDAAQLELRVVETAHGGARLTRITIQFEECNSQAVLKSRLHKKFGGPCTAEKRHHQIANLSICHSNDVRMPIYS